MKSTNVRLQILSGALRLVGRISPLTAARWLEDLFLRLRRYPPSEWERGWRVGSRPFEVRDGGGRRIAGRLWGETGPLVLLVHGWGGRGTQLGAFVGPLLDSGHRVVAFDAPGHGASSGRHSSLVEMADALVAVARRCGSVSGVVAHSAGSAATTIALREGLDVRRLVYLAPPTDLEVFFYRLTDLLRIERPLAELTQQRIERRLGARWADLRVGALAPLQEEPLLIVHDRDDGEVPAAGARELHRLWRGSRLLLTNGLGHRRVLRDPAVVKAAVEFLVCRRSGGHLQRVQPSSAVSSSAFCTRVRASAGSAGTHWLRFWRRSTVEPG